MNKPMANRRYRRFWHRTLRRLATIWLLTVAVYAVGMEVVGMVAGMEVLGAALLPCAVVTVASGVVVLVGQS